jgi:hypothetical protein
MCCGFTAYLNATVKETHLAPGTAADNEGQVVVTMQLNGLSSKEWGLSGRQHIHDFRIEPSI